jgi:hypothetical protein
MKIQYHYNTILILERSTNKGYVSDVMSVCCYDVTWPGVSGISVRGCDGRTRHIVHGTVFPVLLQVILSP